MNIETDNIKYGKEELENLWIAVCCNDIEFMKNYYANGGKPNERYNKFNNDNSLIMGALRNKNYDMVELLKQNGETLLVDEIEEYRQLMVVHNYKDDLTEISNKDKVQDLLDRALEYRKSNVTMPSIQSRLAPEEQETHRKTLEKVIEEMING